MRIAIVGGGIGGASTSKFTRDLFGEEAQIDVFEKNFDRLGGRLSTVQVGKEYYEAGGSVIHPRNKYMVGIHKISQPPSRTKNGTQQKCLQHDIIWDKYRHLLHSMRE
uniref:Prenylcysteine lyase domain-containing protein n=1 Tax=Aplanochytrium stocchinoi TaxID=215587 RepID=A0A7S3V0W4_9STRA|mmetsp:Transcript_12425/g.15412  ORF Transcript_12425/g.15412 Transcript_12425/m.15412 type:complete len:108 (+) Transcript_12425:174-497(+)